MRFPRNSFLVPYLSYSFFISCWCCKIYAPFSCTTHYLKIEGQNNQQKDWVEKSLTKIFSWSLRKMQTVTFLKCIFVWDLKLKEWVATTQTHQCTVSDPVWKRWQKYQGEGETKKNFKRKTYQGPLSDCLQVWIFAIHFQCH